MNDTRQLEIPYIRPFRLGDEAALAHICIATADAGRDASGLLDDDQVWAELFVLPYLERHPELASVIDSGDGRPIGYIVGTDDTTTFEQWFAERWRSRNSARWPKPDTVQTLQQGMVTYGYSRGSVPPDVPTGYPAHLHIDLLPEAQRAGWGRALIERLCASLQNRKVPGVYASVSLANEGALRFYPKVRFAEIAADDLSRTFGRRLAASQPTRSRSSLS